MGDYSAGDDDLIGRQIQNTLPERHSATQRIQAVGLLA
jgi:hypothetical protein